MVTTEHRPAPLPNRPAIQPAGDARPKRPLPAGAKSWSKAYLDENGVPARSEHPVPVDEDGQRTAHVRHTCPHKERAGGGNMAKLGCGMEQWLEPGKTVYCPDHGDQLVPDDASSGTREPLIPWGEVWKTLEKPARPMWFLAAELVAGIAAHQLHLPALGALVGAGILAGGGYVGVRMRLTRREQRSGRLDKGQRDGRNWRTILRRARTAAYLGLAAGGWLTWFSAVDPHSPFGLAALVALPVAWAVGSQPWRRYVAADRNRPAKPAPPPQPVPGEQHGPGVPTDDQADAAQYAARWAAHAGIPNTKLDTETWKRMPFGWQAVIVATAAGALNNLGGDNMRGTVRKVASTFDVPRSGVTWIEEYEERPSQALLLVQPNNPLKRPQLWGGPGTIDVEKGVAEVGRFIDGTPMLETLFRKGWGAPSAISLGTTGGGKSNRVRQRLVIERWASFEDPQTGQRKGLFISMLHDPKRMEVYAEFVRAVHAYGIIRDDAHIIVDALLRECIRRYDMLRSLSWVDKHDRRRKGGIAWNPFVHGPLISHYWDEFHFLVEDKEFIAKLERLARLQRACGMRGEILSHMGTLSDMGTQALRDMLAGGRATLFRTTSGLNGPLVTGGTLVGNPRDLPPQPGMCYVADGENVALLGRESYIPREEHEADVTLYDWLFDHDDNPIGYPAEIPPETAEAFGKEFMEWAEAGRMDARGPLPTAQEEASASTDLRAEDALRQILFQSAEPMKREHIVPLFKARGFSVTSTLTKTFKAGTTANPPWLVKVETGVYGLPLATRQQMTEAAKESENAA
jgi:hypothetical protein